jgi:hypothetical protein
MASNFKIFKHRGNGNLCLNLAGDFDGTSALELVNMLNKNLEDTAYITIDTTKLNKIFPFGKEVLSHNFSNLSHHVARIKFVGDNADQIIPD